ncbi:adenosylcobinamide-phosphate synthase CbiB [Caldibacillus thermoamylovorans]|uniref:adenosylcobinamide-phosphate synthase CbiB n=1 Tax=Caldibacillus thermoamylovorans TaxID=35841 RepID=UPI00203B6145|nr:adenosylcobinamide-phosphate synthase CbiB [Caldibacillus thermoamylovorans]MCM3799037.1 adenosylcobinamide-phosphate synthase CbiB [Caldibacillus thermoamylovorans]
MIIQHVSAITLAYIIDRIVGDPPSWPHPVKWMGSLISLLDKHWNRGKARKWRGFAMVVLILFLVLLVTSCITFIAYRIHIVAGVLMEAVLISTTIAQKGLQDAALEVYRPLQDHQLDEARKKLSYIVGRDTNQLDEREITRGAVETVAENTSDGVTAPMFWAFVGGAPLAFVYRAVNTCDSMVGYINDRYHEFGFASAKLDDLMNWIPARLTGMLMILVNKTLQGSKKEAWQLLFRDAGNHPSPNSGWCEAAAAALLGVQLGGRNTYKGVVSRRALIGNSLRPLTSNDITETIKILKRTSLAFLILLWGGGVFIELANTWFQSALFI